MKYDTYFEFTPVEVQQTRGGSVVQLGFSKSVGISGFQKTINKWIKALLTERGTDVLDREYGTDFVRLIGSNVTSQSDIQTIIEDSVNKATDDVKRHQRQYPPENDNEAFSDAVIQSIVFSSDSTRIDVAVLIENVAGTTLRTLIPVTL